MVRLVAAYHEDLLVDTHLHLAKVQLVYMYMPHSEAVDISSYGRPLCNTYIHVHVSSETKLGCFFESLCLPLSLSYGYIL